MQDNPELLKRLLKMKIKYELERSDFASEEELRRFLEEAEKPEGPSLEENLKTLFADLGAKSQTAVQDIANRLKDELAVQIAAIISETAVEVVVAKLKKLRDTEHGGSK